MVKKKFEEISTILLTILKDFQDKFESFRKF